MTLQSLHQPLVFPRFTLAANGPSIGSDFTLDAAGEYRAFIIRAREAMTISHVGHRFGGAAGSPTAEFRIETVDAATGLSTGTLWATDTNIVTGAITSNTFVLAALTAPASIAANDVFGLKIGYASGTSIILTVLTGWTLNSSLPYSAFNIGTPGTAVMTTAFSVAIGSSATAFYSIPGLFPITTITAVAFNNTNAARRGLRFQVPFKCRIAGFRSRQAAFSGDFNIILMDDAGNELGNTSTLYDGNLIFVGTTGFADLIFDSSYVASPGTWYRAVIEPTTATNTGLSTITLPSANYRSALPWGSNAHYTTYTTAGGWVDSTTDQMPIMDILIDQLDDGVSAGAGIAKLVGQGLAA